MTVAELCYQCQNHPMVPRERAGGFFLECANCDAADPDDTNYPPVRPDDDYPWSRIEGR